MTGIYWPRGEGYEEDQNVDQLIAEQPAVDGNAGAPDERDPSSTYEQRLARSIAPGRDADQRNPASLRGLQALMGRTTGGAEMDRLQHQQ